MENLIKKIRTALSDFAPKIKVILFGSEARGDSKEYSDIDLMIIYSGDTISWQDEKEILTPLYALEFENGKIISPHLVTSKEWENLSRQSTFYHEVLKDGIVL